MLAGCADAGERARQPAAESVRSFERRAAELSAELAACGAEEAAREADLRAADARSTALEVEHAQLDERLSELRRRARELAEQHEISIVDAVEPLAAEEVTALSAKLERLERRRAELGAVNPLAREQYEEERARSEDVSTQIADLQQAVGELDGLIGELSSTIDERFTATYGQVEQGFAKRSRRSSPAAAGGSTLRAGEIPERVDDEALAAEPGEPGIELEVHPRGKRLTSLNLLSGGERALAALAFLFALAFARPCPFYVLDEVDAALDDANIERFLELVRARARARAVRDHHAPEAHDGRRGRAVRRVDGRRRHLARALAAGSARRRGARRMSESAGWDDAFIGFGAARGAGGRRQRWRRRGGWFSRLRENLRRSSRALAAGLAEVAFDPQDAGVWERLEEALLLADVGVPATVVIVERLEAEAAAGRLQGAEALGEALREVIATMLEVEPERRKIDVSARPSVVLLVGVNGTGKTTTIGKLAYRLHEAGASVVIGAADTFRAAAAEQLETWAARASADFVGSTGGADPAAVGVRRGLCRRGSRTRRRDHRHRRPPAHAGAPDGGALQGAARRRPTAAGSAARDAADDRCHHRAERPAAGSALRRRDGRDGHRPDQARRQREGRHRDRDRARARHPDQAHRDRRGARGSAAVRSAGVRRGRCSRRPMSAERPRYVDPDERAERERRGQRAEHVCDRRAAAPARRLRGWRARCRAPTRAARA